MCDLDAQLATFRATHRPVRAVFAGAPWRYFVAGADTETLLLLPGAPGIAEMAFPYMLAFEPRYRVIAPSYPACIRSLEQLLAGLAELLATETNAPVHLIGASYSGLVAQYLLQRVSGRVRSLLIGDTGVARPERAQALSLAASALARLPPAALHLALFAALRIVLDGRSPAHHFWQRYFHAVVATFTGHELRNRVQVMVEMDRQGFPTQAAQAWCGPTLLIENRLDPLFSPGERAALRGYFPQAVIHTMSSHSHTTALTRAAEYITVMRAFLEH